jgi:hypothetical protein
MGESSIISIFYFMFCINMYKMFSLLEFSVTLYEANQEQTHKFY